LEQFLAEDCLETTSSGPRASFHPETRLAELPAAQTGAALPEIVPEDVERVVREVVHVLTERNVSIN